MGLRSADNSNRDLNPEQGVVVIPKQPGFGNTLLRYDATRLHLETRTSSRRCEYASQGEAVAVGEHLKAKNMLETAVTFAFRPDGQTLWVTTGEAHLGWPATGWALSNPL